MACAALAAEDGFDEGPSLAAPGSRAPSPAGLATGLAFPRRAGPPNSRGCSTTGSRESSAERRASSPACRDALLRTRGVLAAARARVVDLETTLVQFQSQRAQQDAMVYELQEQVRSLLESQAQAPSAPMGDAHGSQLHSPASSSRCRADEVPEDSPLQVCEAAVAHLESELVRLSCGDGEGGQGTNQFSHLSEEIATWQKKLQSVDTCSTPKEAATADHLQVLCPEEVAQSSDHQELFTRGRRPNPGALRLVAAAAGRCEMSTVLVLWTAWWSLW